MYIGKTKAFEAIHMRLLNLIKKQQAFSEFEKIFAKCGRIVQCYLT
jgi:hypothetical protein